MDGMANQLFMEIAPPAENIHAPPGEDRPEDHYLGQFIPLHYHHNMLMDENRMSAFKAAIDYAVFDGAKVLELGGGTGALSCLAASKASKVWCVEFNPDMVVESRRLLALNPDGHKVEVIHSPIIQFQRAHVTQAGTTELASPTVYSTLDLTKPNALEIQWEGTFVLESDGVVNALRFITKNILALVRDQATTIDWFIDYLVLPLDKPMEARTGDVLKVTFRYFAGGRYGRWKEAWALRCWLSLSSLSEFHFASR